MRDEHGWQTKWAVHEAINFIRAIANNQNEIYALNENSELYKFSEQGTEHFDKVGAFHRCVTHVVSLQPESDYFVLVTNATEMFVVCIKTGTLVRLIERSQIH